MKLYTSLSWTFVMTYLMEEGQQRKDLIKISQLSTKTSANIQIQISSDVSRNLALSTLLQCLW